MNLLNYLWTGHSSQPPRLWSVINRIFFEESFDGTTDKLTIYPSLLQLMKNLRLLFSCLETAHRTRSPGLSISNRIRTKTIVKKTEEKICSIQRLYAKEKIYYARQSHQQNYFVADHIEYPASCFSEAFKCERGSGKLDIFAAKYGVLREYRSKESR